MNQLQFIGLQTPAATGCARCAATGGLSLCFEEFWLCSSCSTFYKSSLEVYANRRNFEMFKEYLELIKIGKAVKELSQMLIKE